MTHKLLTAASLMFVLALPAYADNCADGIKAMQEAASAENVKPEIRAQVGALIEDAVQAQKKGDGKSCNVKLAEVQALLGTAKN